MTSGRPFDPTGFFPRAGTELSPHLTTVPAGTELWRVHKSKYAPDEFNDRLADIHFGGGRFEGTVLDPYHYLYLAATPLTALAESLLRSVPYGGDGVREVGYAAAEGRALSCLRSRCDLVLVPLLTGADLAAVRCQETLLDDERNYAVSRRWSSEIRAQEPRAQGLLWDSRRNRRDDVMVLYRDRVGRGADGPLEAVPERSVPDLGSPEGLARANEVLAPLRARVSVPATWTGQGAGQGAGQGTGQ
ncbi:RES family NAD+ phosphorylase [Kitasatospora sp. NPDC090308]|uniref:RES family NAD+ phosphorylase n=1 Tax=Kitasatospora sp. NPDC090308 TaxID=3364082 RepID=UPI003802D3F5